ncbi:MAG: hypothetical protein IKP76_02550 [Bacilli bacterium]|nr:hypothetical protein [Bacilli bacterium]
MKLILFDWGNIVESHTTGYTCHNAWNAYQVTSLELDKIKEVSNGFIE